MFASFLSVIRAVGAAIDIQQACASPGDDGPTLEVKIGLSVGEPVEDSNDLFGAAVNLAARLCAHANGAARSSPPAQCATSALEKTSSSRTRARSVSRASPRLSGCTRWSGPLRADSQTIPDAVRSFSTAPPVVVVVKL